MAELSLEPFAARLSWRLTESQPLEGWQDLMAGLLDELAIACSSSKSHVIGHIKALTLLPDGGYLRGSKVSIGYPADVETHIHGNDTPQAQSSHPPNADPAAGDKVSEYVQLETTLNLLVYGLPLDRARSIVAETATSVAGQWEAELEIS